MTAKFTIELGTEECPVPLTVHEEEKKVFEHPDDGGVYRAHISGVGFSLPLPVCE